MAFTPVTILDGNSASKSMGAFQDASSVNYPAYSLDSNMPHYRASASFTPFATAALTVVKLTGSATKTVRVTRVAIGGNSTALASVAFKLIRVSAIGAGGTAVNPTIAKLDTGAANATAVATHYTTAANAADTTTEGSLATFQLFTTTVSVPTVAYNEQMVVFPERGASAMGGQCIVLRGTSEILAITNINGGNLAAGTVLQYSIEWREDAS
jgi:hypothetical protein